MSDTENKKSGEIAEQKEYSGEEEKHSQPNNAVTSENQAARESEQQDLTDEKKQAEEQKQALENEIKETKEKLLRIAADFDNYKKRIKKEIAEKETSAKIEVIKALLPTIDNMQRAIAHAKTATNLDTVISGLQLTEKIFLEALKKLNIERLESVGKPFDPCYHEAIAQQTSDEFAPGTVISEIQSGYVWDERLIRPALVVVSSGPQNKNESNAKEKTEVINLKNAEKNNDHSLN